MIPVQRWSRSAPAISVGKVQSHAPFWREHKCSAACPRVLKGPFSQKTEYRCPSKSIQTQPPCFEHTVVKVGNTKARQGKVWSTSPQSQCSESMRSWLIWLKEMEKHLEDVTVGEEHVQQKQEKCLVACMAQCQHQNMCWRQPSMTILCTSSWYPPKATISTSRRCLACWGLPSCTCSQRELQQYY